MLELIFALIFVMSYLGVGAKYGRKRYTSLTLANVTRPVPKINVKGLKVELAELKNHKTVEHTFACDSNQFSTEGNKRTWCNCGVYRNRDKRIAEINKVLASNSDAVEPEAETVPVIKPVLLWPGYMITDYVRSDVVKINNKHAREIAQAQANVEVAKLRAQEDAILTKQLESR